MNEMILGQIIATTEKINHCTNAKSSIQNVKNSCNSKKNEWPESFRTLDNNSDLCEVKKTDLFEGEIATALQEQVGDARSQIQTGISKADDLEQALSDQCQKLETEIEDLNQHLGYLYQQTTDD